MKLIKWKKDWADEHDVFGFIVLTDVQWEEYIEHSKEVKFPYEEGFGSNQRLEWSKSKEFEQECEIVDITDAEYKMLDHLFTKKYLFDRSIQFGWMPSFDFGE